MPIHREITDDVPKKRAQIYKQKYGGAEDPVVVSKDELIPYLFYVLKWHQFHEVDNRVFLEDVYDEVENEYENNRVGGYIACGGHSDSAPVRYRFKIGWVRTIHDFVYVNGKCICDHQNKRDDCNCSDLGSMDKRKAYKLVFPSRYRRIIAVNARRRMNRYARKHDLEFRCNKNPYLSSISASFDNFYKEAFGDREKKLRRGITWGIPIALSRQGAIIVSAISVCSERIRNVRLMVNKTGADGCQVVDLPPRFGSPGTKTFWRLREKGEEHHVRKAIEYKMENDNLSRFGNVHLVNV